MTDLIPRDAALSLPPYDSDGEPSGMFDHKIFVKLDALRAIPAVDPAAIREAALREAVKSLRDWQTHLNRHSYKETAITIGMSADVVEALIGEINDRYFED